MAKSAPLSTLLLFLIAMNFYCTQPQQVKPHNQDEIVDAFKKKDIAFVIENSSLPFNLQVGDDEGDQEINDRSVLETRLKRLFEKKYFDQFFQWKQSSSSPEEVIFETRILNKAGELESESAFIFLFKTDKEGSLKLSGLGLAG